MTIGIYAIIHRESRKAYIGKSSNIEKRFWAHKYWLQKKPRSEKHTNRHLWNAVQKYGIEAFQFMILEVFLEIDEDIIAERELFWMDMYSSCDRSKGYNLRRDSSTGMQMHTETRLMNSVFNLGRGNPNFGNRWNDSQRERMSKQVKQRHKDGIGYNDEWRAKLAITSANIWKDETKKKRMAEKVSKKKEKYDFEQYNLAGELLRRWPSVKNIVSENPGYKWQNIYSVCNGYKPTYMGFVWKKVLKDKDV